MKLIVSITNPGEAPPDNGRTIHALKLAAGIKAGGGDVKVAFCGKGVSWIARFANRSDDSHPFVKNYGAAFDEVREHVVACNMCCIRFDATDDVRAAEVPILGEGRDHVDLAAWMLDGYQLVNY